MEPGRQNKAVLLARPAKHLDCIVEVPISSYESCLNSSPKPSMCLSNMGANASGVLSRPVNPVPPVVIMTSTQGSAIQVETIARI